jgi:hypothetical protein
MRALYAIQFEIGLPDGVNSGDVADQVVHTVSKWISDWYSTRKGIDLKLPFTEGAISPLQNHDITYFRNRSQLSNVSHSIVTWSYPDDNDSGLFWHSRSEIGEFNGLVEFSFQLFLDSAQYLIAPVEFTLRRPRLIGTLLRDFACSCGDVRLSLEPREILAETVSNFASSRLLSRVRRLPVVLVSRTTHSGKWLIDPSDLSDSLAGIAETYCLFDKWAGFALTDAVGKPYSCFNGAVRVYWPDFDPDETPYSPIYLPNELERLGPKLIDTLFRQMAGLSAFRYVTGPVTTDAVDHLQEERRCEAEALRSAAKDRGDLEQLLVLADKENADLQKHNEYLRIENNSLKTNLTLAQENFRIIGQSLRESQAQIAEPQESDTELDSLEGVVLRAKTDYRDTLTVLDSALESAAESPFMQIKKVSQALLAMHEVCESWRGSRKARKPMGTFEQAFAAKGFDYKSRESMTSRGKWGEEYEVIYRGKPVSIEPHLALGKGGPDTCLRIHFHIDEENEQFVIAHVGRHKTNTKT